MTGPPNGVISRANSAAAKLWYVGGVRSYTRLHLEHTPGVATYAEPLEDARDGMGLYFRYAPSLIAIENGLYWHSDHETPLRSAMSPARAADKKLPGFLCAALM